MRPPRLKQEGRVEIEEAARARFVIPTDKELAYKHQISLRYVQLLMRKIRRQLLRERARTVPT